MSAPPAKAVLAPAEPGTRRASFDGRAPHPALPLEAARALVVDRCREYRAVHSPAVEIIRLDAGGARRVLAQEVTADRDWPPFRRAMRDGYALRAREAVVGTPLLCIGQIPAGAENTLRLPPDACLEIMTGAPVPDDADTVVMIEHTRRMDNRVWFDPGVQTGDNIAARGSDTRRGAIVARPGLRLTGEAIGLLTQAGCLRPAVFARPRLAILATGDELVEAEAAPGPAQIRNSNGPMLAALVGESGADVSTLRRVGDAAGELPAALAAAATSADIVVCSGGASVGAHDGVAPALAAMGAEVYFESVAIRPGRPQWFARLDCPGGGSRLFFGLPGNPLGAWLGFQLFVRPAIALIGGLDPERLPVPFSTARLGFDFHRKELPLTVFRPVTLRQHGLQPPEAHDLPYHGSADLAAAAAADAWMAIPPATAHLAVGTTVMVLRP